MPIKENAADAAQREKLNRQRELSSRTKACDIVISAAFCLFIGGFALLHAVLPDRESSDRENRVLSQFPKFSVESLISGDFGADMTENL